MWRRSFFTLLAVLLVLLWPSRENAALAEKESLEEFLKESIWHWNGWRDVKFMADFSFEAPDPNCEPLGSCTWRIVGSKVEIDWASAGMHYVRVNKGRTKMKGKRFDGDPCHAKFVRKDSENSRGQDDSRGEDEEEEEEDLYAVLGVDPDSDENQIKRAYRKLSRKYHPDKNKGAESAAMFEKVRNAYEIIGDPDNRILYDTGGIETVRDAQKQDAAGGQAMDPFAAFFGGGQQNQERRKAKKGNDARVELEVSLEDMYKGGEVSASINRRIVCRGCKGKPRSGKCRDCGRCPNEIKTELVQMAPGFQVQQQVEVPSKHRCKDESKTLMAQIEKGMGNGAEIRFERMSEQRPGMIPGDVIFVVKEKRHKLFRREGNDLHVQYDISLREALLGFKKTITHLDGHEVVLQSKGITRPFEVRKVKGEGMPLHEVPSEFGDLHVKYKVVFPSHINAQQRAFVEEHF